MLRFKLGALIGFGIGWAVGSGRAAEFWNEIAGSRGGASRPQTGSRPTESVTSDMTARREAAVGS
jgi:hypothetical protein